MMLLRPAEPGDAMSVAGVHVRSWQAAYRQLLPGDYLDGLRAEDRAQKYDFSRRDPRAPQTIVAADGGLICGFATTMLSPDPELPDHGELCALYVDPDHWGRGFGVALVEAGRVRLAALGVRRALLWVLAGNLRAGRFYRNDGWVSDGVRRSISVWGVDVEEIRYVRGLESPKSASTVDPRSPTG